MNIEDACKLGFYSLDHYTFQNAVIYPLGRNRHLSFGSIGTPNEMLFICESSDQNSKEIVEIICLHNYDYDGYMTVERLQEIITVLTTKP